MHFYLFLIITVFVLLGCGLAVMFLLGGSDKRVKISQRLSEIKSPGAFKTKGPAYPEGSLLTRILASCGRIITPKSPLRRRGVEKSLGSAGFYTENAVTVYQGIRVLTPLLLIIIVFALVPLLIRNHTLILLAIAIFSMFLSVFGPPLALRFIARKRRYAIVKGFPDALDLLSVLSEAGIGFDSAIKKVAEEMTLSHPHLSREFMAYIYESQVGVSRQEALRNFAERTNVDIIRAFTALLIQSEKLGTSIVNTLRVYADSMRTKRWQDAEAKAAKLPVLLVFPLMFFIFPSLFLVILGPATISVFQNLIAK